MTLAVGTLGSTRVVQRKRLALHRILLYILVAILLLTCFRMNARRAELPRVTAAAATS